MGPRRVKIQSVITGRYRPGTRPLSWDQRVSGTDKIQTTTGEELTLSSSGQQSTPAPGWEILLMPNGSADQGIPWTLYGVGELSTSK